MNDVFYVIETNKGNGSTGTYVLFDKAQTTDIYKAVKFYDKASAETMFMYLKCNQKDHQITEHSFVE